MLFCAPAFRANCSVPFFPPPLGKLSQISPELIVKFSQLNKGHMLRPGVPATGAETSKVPKVARGGCQKCLGLRGPKACCTGAKEPVALVQETLGRPFLQLVKTLFAPFPDHFGPLLSFRTPVAGAPGRKGQTFSTKRANFLTSGRSAISYTQKEMHVYATANLKQESQDLHVRKQPCLPYCCVELRFETF